MPLLLIALIVFIGCDQKSGTNEKEENTNADTTASKREIVAVMDSVNNAFKSKDINLMLSFFTDDGMYYGTDPGEVWNKKKFTEESTKTLKDSAANFSYDVKQRDIMLDDDANSAIVVEQFFIPMLSNKIMCRGIARLDRKGNTWRIDFYSWNMIPKNEDVPKINKALP